MAPQDIDSAALASAPVNQIKRRPDTHPELRSGLWQLTYNTQPNVIETTTVEATEPGAANDTTTLLAYNPEVRNAAAAYEGPAGTTTITEAAGAEPRTTIVTETPRATSKANGTKRVSKDCPCEEVK